MGQGESRGLPQVLSPAPQWNQGHMWVDIILLVLSEEIALGMCRVL